MSISTGLVVALRRRLEKTSEFANLLYQWITEPTRPSEVSLRNKETTRRLTLLVAALTSSSDDGSAISLPQLRAMNLLQSIRRWISDSDVLQTFDDEDQLLMHSLLLKLLGALARQVQELPGAHWEMMFDYIASVFSGLGHSQLNLFAVTVLERACRLTLDLIELGEEEEDILSAWEDRSEGILVSAMRLNGSEDFISKPASLRMDRPVRQFLEVLSQVCSYAPDSLVLSHGSVTEQCRLLTEPLTGVQMLAYKQLQTMLIEQVQTLSIQMEIKARNSPTMDLTGGENTENDKDAAVEDKMTEPRFPSSLWAIISSPPKGFPAMDVDVDADDQRNFKEEFSLLSVDHHHDDEDEEEYGVGAGVAAKSEKTVSHAVLGYLMAWKLAFAIFENTVSPYSMPLRFVHMVAHLIDD